MKKETRNSKLAKSFYKFCIKHPDYRFYQSLLAWSGLPYILWSNKPVNNKDMGDTFYMEDKNYEH